MDIDKVLTKLMNEIVTGIEETTDKKVFEDLLKNNIRHVND